MDCYALFESKRLLMNFLQKHDPEFHKEVSTKLKFIDKFNDGHTYGDAMVNGTNYSRISTHIQQTLTSIQSRLQWQSSKYDCTDLDRLSAEQHCEIVIAADEYYRKCVSEPAGSQASWNARDQHMTTTLLRIQAHLNDPKVIVWAHNSHVGDSTATNRGGASFKKNETWNVGQMVRATFGVDKTWIVGQYTSSGTVTAANNWGGKQQDFVLNDSLPESYEGAFRRDIVPHINSNLSFTFLTAPFADASSAASASKTSSSSPSPPPIFPAASLCVTNAVNDQNPIALALVELCHPKIPRLQRWVGVQYKPNTERQSHYGELTLSKCYDQIIYMDQTSGLLPIPKMVKKVDTSSSSSSSSSGTEISTRSSNKRLLKEYRRLQKASPPGILAVPNPENILEWHFCLIMDKLPYRKGVYHGTLTFPMEYPMRPPRFQMITPSGRFEPNTRLCLSMSKFCCLFKPKQAQHACTVTVTFTHLVLSFFFFFCFFYQRKVIIIQKVGIHHGQWKHY